MTNAQQDHDTQANLRDGITLNGHTAAVYPL
jgi:hypothetical protein